MAEAYFKKALKGYDTAQVDEFIIKLSDAYSEKEKSFADELRSAQNEISRLRDEIARLNSEAERVGGEHSIELAEQRKEYDAMCATVGDRLITAENRAIDIIKSAEAEAESIRLSAQSEVDAIREQTKIEAESDAESIRQRAREDAERLINETEQQCAKLTRAADEFRKRQIEMQQSIYETERSFGDALNKLRDDITQQ